MAIRLKKSEVVFNKLPHTYELNGKVLKGVTQILHELPMFKDMYSTEAFDRLKANEVWKDSGYTEKDLCTVERNGNITSFVGKGVDDFMFFCSDEEKTELHPILVNAINEQVRIETNKHNAAIRGTAVHDACEAVDQGKTTGNEDAMRHALIYKSMREGIGMKTISTEYLVSDNDIVASSIDLVWADENDKIFLADIKTTSKMDATYTEYLRWQLSIYKYLFELQNKSKKVEGLYGVWLPQKEQYGKARIFPLEPVPTDEIVNMLTCIKEERAYAPVEQFTLPENITAGIQEYLEAKAKVKEYSDIVKKFESELLSLFDEHDIKKWEFSDKANFTRTLPTTKQTFDQKALEAAEPEIYNKYLKTTTTKSSLRVTIK